MTNNNVSFIGPPIHHWKKKTFYKSCIIRGELEVNVGDIVDVRYRSSGYFARVISLYDDLDVKTMNSAGSTLDSNKADVLCFFSYLDIPANLKNSISPEISEYPVVYVPELSERHIPKESFLTIEIPMIVDSKSFIFGSKSGRKFSDVDNYRDSAITSTQIQKSGMNNKSNQSTSKLMKKSELFTQIRIISGFNDKVSNLDPEITLEKSTRFATAFLEAVIKILWDIELKNKRHPLLKPAFKIDHWFESTHLKMVLDQMAKEKYPVLSGKGTVNPSVANENVGSSCLSSEKEKTMTSVENIRNRSRNNTPTLSIISGISSKVQNRKTLPKSEQFSEVGKRFYDPGKKRKFNPLKKEIKREDSEESTHTFFFALIRIFSSADNESNYKKENLNNENSKITQKNSDSKIRYVYNFFNSIKLSKVWFDWNDMIS